MGIDPWKRHILNLILFACTYVYAPGTCLVPTVAIGSDPETGETDGCKPPWGCWIKWGGLIITEPSLQPQKRLFWVKLVVWIQYLERQWVPTSSVLMWAGRDRFCREQTWQPFSSKSWVSFDIGLGTRVSEPSRFSGEWNQTTALKNSCLLSERRWIQPKF